MNKEFEDCLKKGKIRPFSRGKGLAGKELEAAGADLVRARKTFEEGDFKWATVQLYYSMFHAARALLYIKNLREHSHFCLIAAMQSLYVNSGQIPLEHLEAYKKAKNLREDADYYDRWSKEGCEQLLNAAEKFLQKAKQITSTTS